MSPRQSALNPVLRRVADALIPSPSARAKAAPKAHTLEFQKISSHRSKAPADYMSWRSCPVCGGEQHRPLLEYENFQFYTDADVSKQATIRQVQCLDCFGVFMNPVFTPEGFAVLFAEAGASYGSTSGRQTEQIAWLTDHGLLAPGSTLLDIGCYEGSFIGKLPTGIKGVGVDIDQPAIERARKRFSGTTPHDFICADFENFEVSAAINTITMFHVLEHLPQPVIVLKRLADLATSRTRLLVEVPVVENVIYGDVCGFVTVQHLTHFSIASLTNVMHAAGWRIIEHQAMEGYNGFRVVAEPAARAECRRSEKDIGSFLTYLSRWYEAVGGLEERLRRIKTSQCVVRGGGLQTEYLFHLTSLFGNGRNFLIADSDPLKAGKSWRGIPILGLQCLDTIDWSRAQMVLSSYSHQDAMREEARAKGIPDAAVIQLYDHIYRY
jgi:hypothetical protein